MPCDCDMSSKAFYAADPEKWKEILRLMYSYCIDIVEEKGRRTSTLNVNLTEKFLLLSSKCTKQVLCFYLAISLHIINPCLLVGNRSIAY